ncbi:hypothetical protein ATCVCanal1_628L [Acanthocystis turfacea Chlorella virus Canal-1]|nr:hypothetical protein ATCVCanal1_628L [Acanthocystis turfacea Chlorella virus Canal-1]
MVDAVKMLSKKCVTFDRTVVVHVIPLEGNAHPLPREGRNPALRTYTDVQKEIARRRWVSADHWHEAFEDQKEFVKETKKQIRRSRGKGDNAQELQESIDLSMLEISLLLSLKWHYGIDRIDPCGKRQS